MDRPFYGWLIVASSFIVLATAFGMQFSYGIYVPFLESELGLDRATASAPLSVYLLVYGVTSAVSGQLTDKIGPRKVVAIGGVLLAIGYMLLSQATSLWQAYIFLGVVAGIGMSGTFVPLNATVVRWFVRKRGTALAITGSGANLATIIGPLTATLLITYFGWRSSMLLIGLAAGCIIVTCAMFLYKDPESRNLAPDGVETRELGDIQADAEYTSQFTRKEAVRTRTFWVILAIFFFTWTTVFFPVAHLPSLVQDYGYSETFGASLIGAIGLGGFTGRLVIGVASDRFGRRGGLCISLVMQVMSCLLFAFFDSPFMLSCAALLFGAASGSATTLFPAIVADMFGRIHVGAISGLVVSIGVIGSALGPYAAGLMRDAKGDYVAAFFIAALLNLGALLFVGFLRKPVAPRNESAVSDPE